MPSAGRSKPPAHPLHLLFVHEQRLRWRGLVDFLTRARGHRERRLLLWIVAIIAVAHLVMWPIAAHARQLDGGEAALALRLAVVCALMFAAALDTVTYALFARGDYDLLFSAPVRQRDVFSVRLLAIMTATALQMAIYAAPFVNMMALLDGPGWLLAYPVGLALVMLCTVAAAATCLALVAMLGVRRTRLAAQLTAALTGLSVVLLLQSQALLARMEGIAGTLSAVTWLPAAALSGTVPSLLLLFLVAAGAVLLSVRLLSGPFVATATLAAGTAAPARRDTAPGRQRPFATRWPGVLVRKELRLVLRDPWLISQVSMQCLYLLPVGVVLAMNGVSDPLSMIMLPALVTVLAGQLAGSLAWIALSAEDAPELIAVAPVEPAAVQRAKLIAIGCLTAGAVMPLSGLLALLSPLAGLVALAGGTIGAIVAVQINIWFAGPARKTDFMRRKASSSLLVNGLEVGVLMVLAVAAGLATHGSLAALLPLGLAIAVMAVLAALRPRADYDRRTVPGRAPSSA